MAGLIDLVERRAPETETDAYLRARPTLLVHAADFFDTGHHGAWMVPQQMIRPPTTDRPGLKPDYLLGGKNSEGFSWYVVELKGPDTDAFVQDPATGRPRFSGPVHRGVFQLLEYLDYCVENQAYLRDHLRLTEFREPRGILIVGREAETELNPRLQKTKAAWNRLTRQAIVVRSYDALIRGALKICKSAHFPLESFTASDEELRALYLNALQRGPDGTCQQE